MSESCCAGKKQCCGNTAAESPASAGLSHEHHHHPSSSSSHPSPTRDQGNNEKVATTKAASCGHSHEHMHRPNAGHSVHKHRSQQKNGSSLCLAVVRENGADIVVFDASGAPRTFSYKGDIRSLCFKTHGREIADDLLTPCFDEDGNHGSPEEDCFCGVDTPHLHAHLYDPKICSNEGETKGAAICSLASQVLHPTGDESPMVHISVSDSMPRECNSKRIIGESDAVGGKKHHDWRRLHQVQHDDHVDYLVHNAKTGDLHLEHSCSDCGSADVHGSFQAMGQRRLKRSDRGDIQLHFFEVAQRPFSILEYIHSAFELKSDRVAAATMENASTPPTRRMSKGHHSAMPVAAAVDEVKKTVVSSTLHCTGICCAAECPVIKKILTPVPGVENILINIPLKQVIVKHDALIVSAADLENALNEENMGASVKRDGAEAAGISPSSPQDTIGRSQFCVANICCASEIRAISKIIEQLEGVELVSINTTSKTVYVDHKISVITARDLGAALSAEGFEAEIRFDGATSATSARATFVQSTLTLEPDMEPDTELLTSFMHGFDSSQMESFFMDVPSRKITVLHNPFCLTAQSVVELLQKETGLIATVTIDGADPDHWKFPKLVDDSMEGLDEDESFTYPKPTVILSGICWIVSMLNYVGENWEYLKYVGLASVAFGLPPIALKAFKTLRRCQFDTNCLMLFASVGAVALQEFAEAAAVVFLFAISEWLEVRATARARRALSAIVHLRPDRANIVHPTTRELITVPATSVPVGAIVSVRTGDKIPCDGVVVEGISTVDESSLTGESRPIRKCPEDKVSGGTVNSGLSQLVVKTTATTENSAVSRLIRLVEEAQANRSETEKLIDEFARWYTPIVVLVAILMCSVPWAFGEDTGREWTFNGLILIVVACPCAMIISTPISYVAGLAAAAQKGILIKGGATLEALGVTKNICFDKTGTLTNGEFAVLHLRIVPNSLPRNQVLQYLSLMEERASHPVAQALVTAARNEQVTVPAEMVLEKHRIVAGEGVEGVVNGLAVSVGNERMFDRVGLLNDLDESIKAEVESWKMLGGTVGFMSVEDYGIVCSFCAADGVREESARVLEKLRKKGINMMMLTGDNADTALAIGQQIGINNDQIKSKLLPEEKLQFIEDLSCSYDQNRSAVCMPCGSRNVTLMVGDGVNDAPALAAADIGVAMGAGAALAMETADVTLLDSNLEKLGYSIDMGKRVIRKIKENVIFSIAVKFLVLALALAGKTHLWAAIGSDVGAMILVTLNSMSLLPRRQRREDVLTLKSDIEQGSSGRRNGDSRQESPSTIEGSAPVEPPSEKPIREKACCSNKPLVSGPMKTGIGCQKECCSKTAKVENSNGSTEGFCSKKNPLPTEEGKTASGCQRGSYLKVAVDGKSNSGHSCKKGCCSKETMASKPVRKGCCSENAKIEGSSVDDGCEEGCCPKKNSPVELVTTISSCQTKCSSKNTEVGESGSKSCESFAEPTGASSTGGCCSKYDMGSTDMEGCCYYKNESGIVSKGSCKKDCCSK